MFQALLMTSRQEVSERVEYYLLNIWSVTEQHAVEHSSRAAQKFSYGIRRWSAVSSPSGSGQSTTSKWHLVYFGPEKMLLVRAIMNV